MSYLCLQDYRRAGVSYHVDLEHGSVSELVGKPEMTRGYASYVRRHVFRKGAIFVACFLENDELNVVIGPQRYNLSRESSLEVSIIERMPFSVYKRFQVLKSGEVVYSLRYVSTSSSGECWPDDFVDICRYITKLPRHDTKALRVELVREMAADSGCE